MNAPRRRPRVIGAPLFIAAPPSPADRGCSRSCSGLPDQANPRSRSGPQSPIPDSEREGIGLQSFRTAENAADTILLRI